jgi:hypothetical protein
VQLLTDQRDTEKSRRYLNDLTRSYFLGYEWRNNNDGRYGVFLQLQPRESTKLALDTPRVVCLLSAFNSVGVYDCLQVLRNSKTGMTVRHKTSTTKPPVIEIETPDSEFLMLNKHKILKVFEEKYRSAVGRTHPPFQIIGGPHACLESVP